METCQDLGKEPDKTFKGSFNVRLNPELHKQASLLASRKKVTLNELIKKSISYVVSHESELDSFLVKG
ncbi:MAG: toxin-antitoxin system HicB family antitoxin [Bacteroidales bacterium]|nr:toxin-antitoxin system HicB family antitoxin [Bacteroidales bacterium]MCF8457464.1 toxin-antitoxin system HicB family antitoxin [Bacteroidales bacterium]